MYLSEWKRLFFHLDEKKILQYTVMPKHSTTNKFHGNNVRSKHKKNFERQINEQQEHSPDTLLQIPILPQYSKTTGSPNP